MTLGVMQISNADNRLSVCRIWYTHAMLRAATTRGVKLQVVGSMSHPQSGGNHSFTGTLAPHTVSAHDAVHAPVDLCTPPYACSQTAVACAAFHIMKC